MKNALMIVSPNSSGLMNIGDYIQAQAARQFFDNINVYIDRDWGLNKEQKEKVRMIMNGWYMDHPENFPPSEDIIPLYVSMHINNLGLPGLLREECVDYFKKHAPIGCRDYNTVELLKGKGVDAYFTGCLTLTLGRKYHYSGKREGIYIVEPHFSTKDISRRPILLMKSMLTLIFHYQSVKCIAQKKKDVSFKSLLHNAVFFKEYNKVFDKEILLKAQYINQMNREIGEMSYEERLKYAEKLIQMYAKAECVITSRIHCALPCLGLETPVLFVVNSEADKMSTMRFGGLLNLLNTIRWENGSLIWKASPINRATFPKNKTEWKVLANELIRKCEKFAGEK